MPLNKVPPQMGLPLLFATYQLEVIIFRQPLVGSIVAALE